MNISRMTGSLEIVVVAYANPIFLDRMSRALEEASSTALPVSVKDFYGSHMKASEILDCCGFILIHQEADIVANETEAFSDIFSSLLMMMIGRGSVLMKERVVLLHHSEAEVLETLCDSFEVVPASLYEDKDDIPIGWFSLAQDFTRSRRRRRLNEQQKLQ